MAPRTSSPPTIATFHTAARLLGAFQTAAGLGLAVVVASGLTYVAHDNLTTGLWTLIGALAARWILTQLGDEWSDRAARVIREQWRAQLLGHFRQPRREGGRSRGDLALAIDNASHAPALELLEASAQTALLGLVVVFWAAGWLSTVIVIALLALAVPFYQRAGKRSAALEEEYHQRRALLESRQLELLHHAPELRALGAVAYGANEIAAISDSEHSIALRAIRVALESSLVTEFLSGVSIGLVAMVVGFELLGGRIALGHALIAVLATSELFGHVRRFGSEFHRREDAAASLELLVQPTTLPSPPPADDLVTAVDLVTEASTAPVSLHVGSASRTLVTGASGSGKTTLLHTLLGWRTPRSGSVRRSDAKVGYVSVESALFSGSLWDNLTLGVDVEPSRVHRQLADLGLVGPRFSDLSASLLADGRGLSSGERVRLVLARSLLADTALLVIDDIGGVLDRPTRDLVARALEAHPSLAIIEATVDTPVLGDAHVRVEIQS